MTPDEEDRSLVAAALDGSRGAAEAIVDRHWRTLWHIAHGITGDAAGAEDVVQDAFAAAFRRLDRFDPRRASLRTWLSRITVNRALNCRRDQRPTQRLPESFAAPQVERRDDAGFLAAIAGLSDAHRAVVVLRYGLDYTPQEIADILGVRVGTVHSRLARALSTLRRTMGGTR